MKHRRGKLATRCIATWIDRYSSDFRRNFLLSISGTLVDRYKHTRRQTTEE